MCSRGFIKGTLLPPLLFPFLVADDFPPDVSPGPGDGCHLSSHTISTADFGVGQSYPLAGIHCRPEGLISHRHGSRFHTANPFQILYHIPNWVYGEIVGFLGKPGALIPVLIARIYWSQLILKK